MNYQQVIEPDLNTVGDVGWCLAFVEKAFNATTYSYATARDGWDACQFIHRDRNLPDDVCVPIWFDYYEGGVNYGHVAIWVPGRGILSSPWRADNTQQWEPDIDTISRVYNSTYLGWSEDLMGKRVIKEGEDMVPDENHLQALYRAFRLRNATPDEVTSNVGKTTYTSLVEQLDSGDERTAAVRAAEVGEIAISDHWADTINQLKAQAGNASEANLLGQALIKLLTAFGYKKA